MQRALSTLQNSLSNAIEKPAIRLNRVVKADARINPFLLALMSESPEKILRMLDIDIPDTIDPFLTFLIVLREDPRIVNQIIRKWDDKNMVSATQEVIIANEEDTKEIPSFVPYSETVQTEKTRRNMSGMLMSIL